MQFDCFWQNCFPVRHSDDVLPLWNPVTTGGWTWMTWLSKKALFRTVTYSRIQNCSIFDINFQHDSFRFSRCWDILKALKANLRTCRKRFSKYFRWSDQPFLPWQSCLGFEMTMMMTFRSFHASTKRAMKTKYLIFHLSGCNNFSIKTRIYIFWQIFIVLTVWLRELLKSSRFLVSMNQSCNRCSFVGIGISRRFSIFGNFLLLYYRLTRQLSWS